MSAFGSILCNGNAQFECAVQKTDISVFFFSFFGNWISNKAYTVNKSLYYLHIIFYRFPEK